MDGYAYNSQCPCVRCRTHGLMGPAILISLGLAAFFRHGWSYFVPVVLIVIGVVQVLKANAPTDGHIPPFVPLVPVAPVAPAPQVPVPSETQENRNV